LQKNIHTLMNTLPQTGKVIWIGLRPAKKAMMQIVDSVTAQTDNGLTGDRYAGRTGKRQVTLVQEEHLSAIASILDRAHVPKNKQFHIGNAIFEYTGLCHPCSYMEEVFGDGGYNAIRGHGGITARVVQSGVIQLNDRVHVCSPSN